MSIYYIVFLLSFVLRYLPIGYSLKMFLYGALIALLFYRIYIDFFKTLKGEPAQEEKRTRLLNKYKISFFVIGTIGISVYSYCKATGVF